MHKYVPTYNEVYAGYDIADETTKNKKNDVFLLDWQDKIRL